MNIFTLKHIDMEYKNGTSNMKALNDINIEIKSEEKIAIVGESGAGKSTLLNVLSGMEIPSNGKLFYEDKEMKKLSHNQLADLRLKNFGMVFQSFYLIPTMTVRDNIWLPAIMAYNKVCMDFFDELVLQLGLGNMMEKMPNQLSGGEKQRVAIARSLINKPKVLFADEPTGNLDSTNGEKVFEVLFECAKKYNQTLIFVTHDNAKAKLAERTIILKDGVVVE